MPTAEAPFAGGAWASRSPPRPVRVKSDPHPDPDPDLDPHPDPDPDPDPAASPPSPGCICAQHVLLGKDWGRSDTCLASGRCVGMILVSPWRVYGAFTSRPSAVGSKGGAL